MIGCSMITLKMIATTQNEPKIDRSRIVWIVVRKAHREAGGVGEDAEHAGQHELGHGGGRRLDLRGFELFGDE